MYDVDKDSPTFFCHLLPGLLHPLKKLSRYWRFSGILTSPPWVNCVVTALLFGLHPEQLAEMIPVEMHEAHELMDLGGDLVMAIVLDLYVSDEDDRSRS